LACAVHTCTRTRLEATRWPRHRPCSRSASGGPRRVARTREAEMRFTACAPAGGTYRLAPEAQLSSARVSSHACAFQYGWRSLSEVTRVVPLVPIAANAGALSHHHFPSRFRSACAARPTSPPPGGCAGAGAGRKQRRAFGARTPTCAARRARSDEQPVRRCGVPRVGRAPPARAASGARQRHLAAARERDADAASRRVACSDALRERWQRRVALPLLRVLAAAASGAARAPRAPKARAASLRARAACCAACCHSARTVTLNRRRVHATQAA
jgi:hypothetical protein